MIGNRIRLARLANCLSLQQLSDHMKENNVNITKTALFNYESNSTLPNEQILNMLSLTLGLNKHFFTHDSPENFFIKTLGNLGSVESRRQELLAYIQLQVEYSFSVFQKSNITIPAINIPNPSSASNLLEAEAAATSIRKHWSLGYNPIASVCHLLESNGVFLFSLPNTFHWKYVSGIECSHNIHFLFFSNELYLDELRFGLLKEFGKHVMTYDPEDEDLVLEEFAASILLPRELLYKEFGNKRTHIDLEELRCIKKKYGIPRLTILKRLQTCGIISNETCHFFTEKLRHSYHISHSSIQHVTLNFFEEPTVLHLLVRRAIAEGFILDENDLDYKSAWNLY